MRVARVVLRDFRNYERLELELEDGLTVVHGSNGAGKTNLLEGVYFGLTGRSCRTRNERELLRAGAGPARAAITTIVDGVRHELELALDRQDGKRARIDGGPADPARASEVRPPVAVFLPERLDLVKGPPAPRRAHLDRFLAAVWPAREAARTGYARALAQRNALLARVRAGAGSADQLDSWDAQLAEHAAALIANRAAAVERLAPRFAARAAELGLAGAVELRYRPRCRTADPAGIAAELTERRAQDFERGFTTHGPHRDDLALAHEGRALRAYGSQGQQRLALLALLFAERDVLAERGREPLLLLDDVMSELDARRRSLLVELVEGGGQTLLTTTDPEHVPLAAGATAATIAVERGSANSLPRVLAA